MNTEIEKFADYLIEWIISKFIAIGIMVFGFCIDNGLTNIGNAILKYLDNK